METIGGVLLCLLSVITPWLYGTTENWSVRLMNIGSFATGGIFLAAWVFNRFSGREDEELYRSTGNKIIAGAFLFVNLALLAFCAVAYYNARAAFSIENQNFTYFDNYNPSLPTTYDKHLTGEITITYLAYFIVFWSARYWLNGGELQALRRRRENRLYNNRRFRALLWVLMCNGILLAAQATLQRMTGSEKLLWIRHSWWKTAEACFGPFSYRGNAADYFNLIWPIAFGFFILLLQNRRASNPIQTRRGEGPQLLLVPGLILTAVAPFLSLSRGGAIVAAIGLAAFLVLILSLGTLSLKARLGFAALLLSRGLAGWMLAGNTLMKRFDVQKDMDMLGGRTQIYENAEAITRDYPVFGTGPGSFRSVYHLYRTDLHQWWHAFVHDDWLETRVTFGWVGFSLAILQLLLLVAWILWPGRPGVTPVFTGCILISLLGTLLHAKFDFPFQTYSIFFTFIVISALAVSGSPVKRP